MTAEIVTPKREKQRRRAHKPKPKPTPTVAAAPAATWTPTPPPPVPTVIPAAKQPLERASKGQPPTAYPAGGGESAEEPRLLEARKADPIPEPTPEATPEPTATVAAAGG
jgi:hypothetical protein